MPRSHKPRKRYVPKHVTPNTVGLVLDAIVTLTLAQQAELLAPIQGSLEAFRTGRGSADDWANLADAMNVGEALAQLAIGADHADTFNTAQAALAAVHARIAERKSYTLRGAELTALDDAVFVHRIQLEHCSQGELLRAVDNVKRRVGEALKGNASPTAHVCGALGRPITTTDTRHHA
jgi:hypothetical protein